MKTVNLREFRAKNHLTQSQVGDYLGIKKSFISSIEGGKAPLPAEKFAKLLDNDQGWDTDMLAGGDVISQNGSHNNIEKVTNRPYSDIALVKSQENLNRSHELIAKSQEQIDRLLTIIEKIHER